MCSHLRLSTSQSISDRTPRLPEPETTCHLQKSVTGLSNTIPIHNMRESFPFIFYKLPIQGSDKSRDAFNAMPSEPSEPHPQIGVNSLTKYRDSHHVPSEIRNIMRLAQIVIRLDLPEQLKPSADRVVADLSSLAV